MRFSLKDVGGTYGLMTKRMACRDMVDVRPRARIYGQSVIGNPIFTNHLVAPVSLL
jgi:hypothetical protein